LEEKGERDEGQIRELNEETRVLSEQNKKLTGDLEWQAKEHKQKMDDLMQ